MSKLIVGAGTAAVELGEDSFPNAENYAGINDNHVRALYIECKEPLLIVTIEITSIMSQAQDMFMAAAKEQTGLDEDHIWICATHTFGGPHIWDDDAPRLETDDHRIKNARMRQAFTDSVTAAVSQAMSSKKEAKIGYGEAMCNINVSRDIETKDGWWLGHNEDEVSDRTVAVIKFTDLNDEPVALVFNYGIQSSVTEQAADENGMYRMTGDVAGAACLYLEKEYGVPAVFLVGACGDQAPMFSAHSMEIGREGEVRPSQFGQKEAFTLMEYFGTRLGEAAAKAAGKAVCNVPEGDLVLDSVCADCPAQKIRPIPELHATHDYDYREGGTAPLTLVGAGIDGIAIVGALPEMSSKMALKLKEESPARHTILLNMVSTIKNTRGKYLTDTDAYGKYKYEAMNSFYARGSAEQFQELALSLIEKIDR